MKGKFNRTKTNVLRQRDAEIQMTECSLSRAEAHDKNVTLAACVLAVALAPRLTTSALRCAAPLRSCQSFSVAMALHSRFVPRKMSAHRPHRRARASPEPRARQLLLPGTPRVCQHATDDGPADDARARVRDITWEPYPFLLFLQVLFMFIWCA